MIRGQVDVAVERELIEAVEAVYAGSDDGIVVELDLREVDFLDSSGLRVLLLLRQAHGDRLVVGARSGVVQRLLDVAGLARIFGETDVRP